MALVFACLGLVILAFIIGPPLKMVWSSGPGPMRDALSDATVLHSIWLTLYAAGIATAAGFVLGVPLAYLLARHEFPGKRLIESLVSVPIVLPHSVAGIALLFVFGRKFLFGRAFDAVGVQFVDATAGIVVAMLFVSVPFLIESAKEGFKRVDVKLERVARTLGASPWHSFCRVSFPLAWRSILAGVVMMWARGLSEFGAVIVIAYHPMVAPVLVYQRFESYGLNSATPVAAVLILVSFLAIVGLRTLAYHQEET